MYEEQYKKRRRRWVHVVFEELVIAVVSRCDFPCLGIPNGVVRFSLTPFFSKARHHRKPSVDACDKFRY